MATRAAFQLNIGNQVLGVPVQLSIPVAPGTPVGTHVVFYRAGQTVNSAGQIVPIWWESENGVVGTDGMAHTASPPEQGSENSGLYLMVQTGLSNFSDIDITVDIANIAADAFDADFEFGGSGGDSLAGIDASVDVDSIDATMAFPTLPQPEPLLLGTITPVGLPTTTTLGDVMINPNAINTFTTTIAAPPVAVGATPPVITSAMEDIYTTNGAQPNSQAYPEVVLTGTDFTTSIRDRSPPRFRISVSYSRCLAPPASAR